MRPVAILNGICEIVPDMDITTPREHETPDTKLNGTSFNLGYLVNGNL
jgi:hypothetical protein